MLYECVGLGLVGGCLPLHQVMLDFNTLLAAEHSLSGYEVIIIFLVGAVAQCILQIAFYCVLSELICMNSF